MNSFSRRALLYLVCVVVSISLVGCGSERRFNESSFFESVALERQEVSIEASCRPGGLWVVQDSLILISNQGRRDSLFVVLDGEDYSVVSSFGDRGVEFTEPFLVKSASEILVYDTGFNRFSSVNIVDSVSIYQMDLKLPDGDDSTFDVFHNNSTFIFENVSTKAAGSLVMRSGNTRKIFRDFTDVVNLTGTMFGYSGALGVNPKSGRVVYAYEHMHRFEIYNSDGKLLGSVVNPDAEMPKLRDGRFDRLNSKIYYRGVSTTAERIYLYYIGLSPNEFEESDMISYVEEFDWDGSPVKRYELDDYFSFVTYVNGAFFCVSPNLDRQFATYKIE